MELPVGYRNFHRDAFINYQLNRWYALGFTRKEDIEQVGAATRTFDDYVQAFIEQAEQAWEEHRLKNAAFYYRAAEFFVSPWDERKLPLYETFRALFYEAFAADHLTQHTVSYADGYLPVLRLIPASRPPKGTLLAFGGFDSCIEEFYCMWDYFARMGYKVLAFEGPGQGAALRKYGLPFDHDWEKPTRAVLEHFGVTSAAVLGVSMGGYWCLRAAAFEKRIRRVISFPPVYDWMEMTNAFVRALVFQLMKWERLMNALVRLKMMNGKLRHTINQICFMTHREQPIDAVRWLMAMNKSHLHAERVDQDVLLLGGENDAFQPPVLLRKQEQALTQAQSVTTRIFTADEHADQHCQMGNLQLALQVMTDWLDRGGAEG